MKKGKKEKKSKKEESKVTKDLSIPDSSGSASLDRVNLLPLICHRIKFENGLLDAAITINDFNGSIQFISADGAFKGSGLDKELFEDSIKSLEKLIWELNVYVGKLEDIRKHFFTE